MIYIDIEVLEDSPDGIVFEDLCTKQVDHGYGVKNMSFKKYAAGKDEDSGTAHVTIGETIGGPLYSSIKITVGASVPCRPDAISDVHDILFDDCLEKLDAYVKPTYEALLAKLREERPKELIRWQQENSDG